MPTGFAQLPTIIVLVATICVRGWIELAGNSKQAAIRRSRKEGEFLSMSAASCVEVVAVDHVSWTMPDLDAAIAFYTETFGATVLFRIGPIDAADIPRDAQGRDWMATHVGVPEARLTLAMLQFAGNLKVQFVQYDKPAERRTDPLRNCDRGGHHLGILVKDVMAAAAVLAARGCNVLEPIVMTEGPLAGKTNLYCQDPWGNQLELVD
jgi:glyoxylase I family protein